MEEVTQRDKDFYFAARLDAGDRINLNKPMNLSTPEQIQAAMMMIALRTKKSLDIVLGERHHNSDLEWQIRNFIKDHQEVQVRAMLPNQYLFLVTESLWSSAGAEIKTYEEDPNERPARFGYFAVSDKKAYWYELPDRANKTTTKSIINFDHPITAEKLTTVFKESFEEPPEESAA